MDWPSTPNLPDPLVTISPLAVCSLAGQAAGSFTIGAVAYPGANTAFFVPFRLSRAVLFKLLFAWNGAAVSGNIDVGIYSRDGTRLVSSGSTAQAGTSVIQTFDVTDTLIGPGVFYLAIAMDNGTGQITRFVPGLAVGRLLGMAQMATAFPLPATATLAVFTTNFAPIIGATTRTVV
jgi:hypothetical protein